MVLSAVAEIHRATTTESAVRWQ